MSYLAVARNTVSEDKKAFLEKGNRADVFAVLKLQRDRPFMTLYKGISHFEHGKREMKSYDCFCFVLRIWQATRLSCD